MTYTAIKLAEAATSDDLDALATIDAAIALSSLRIRSRLRPPCGKEAGPRLLGGPEHNERTSLLARRNLFIDVSSVSHARHYICHDTASLT